MASDTRQGGLETLLVFATQILTLLMTVVVQSLLAHRLGAGDRGVFAVLLLFGTTIGVFFTFGVDRASQYFAMSHRIPMWPATAAAAIVIMCGSILAIGVTWPLIGSDIAFFKQASALQFAHALPLVPVSGLLILLQLQAAGRRQFRILALAALLQGLANLALLLYFLAMPGDGAVAAIYAHTISCLLACFLILLMLIRIERPALRVTIKDVRAITSYGTRYYVARVGNLIDLGLGTILLALVADSASIGIYAAISALTLKAFLITESIEAAILPRIAADPDHRIDLVLASFRISTMLVAVAAVGLCIVAPVAVPLLFSEAFSPGIGVVWLLAPGLVLQGGACILMAYYRGANKPEICSLAVWIGLSVNAVAFFLLYGSCGMYAAGIAMTLGFLVRYLLLAGLFRRMHAISLRTLYAPASTDRQLVTQTVDALRSRMGALTLRKQ